MGHGAKQQTNPLVICVLLHSCLFPWYWETPRSKFINSHLKPVGWTGMIKQEKRNFWSRLVLITHVGSRENKQQRREERKRDGVKGGRGLRWGVSSYQGLSGSWKGRARVAFAILTGVRGVCVLVGLAEHGTRLPSWTKSSRNTNIYKHSSTRLPLWLSSLVCNALPECLLPMSLAPSQII